MHLFEGFSWVGLLQIIGIDIILSGDNALVIALACRSLPRQQRQLGIWLGTGAAVVLRIAFAAAIVYLLMVPLLKLAGSILLLWIAVKLLIPEEPTAGGHADGKVPRGTLWNAIKTVVIADAVMSFDNVISVAAAAKGSVGLLALGIAISIPLMVIGAQMMLWLLDRFPWLMVAGSGLLGWIAGELAVTDRIVDDWLGHPGALVHYGVAATCALLVILVGLWLARRQTEAHRAASFPEL